MKKKTLLAAVYIMSLVLVCPAASARGRQTAGNTTVTATPSRSTSTSGASARPAGGQSGAASRPATPGGNMNQGGATQRPGSSANPGGATQRPGTPNTRPQQPATPPQNNRPTPPPQYNRPTPPPPARPNGFMPGYSYRPPMPHTPPGYTYVRPTPPPGWRPSVGAPNFNTILGVALGTMLSNTVNTWYNYGYHVAGYTDNAVYLNNVNYCNVNWPNATMYYKFGCLTGSLFSSSSLSYDMSRYNYVYSMLMSQYGAPVSIQTLSGGGTSATWWGYNNTYITLSFYPEYVAGLGMRYFTTLSTGY